MYNEIQHFGELWPQHQYLLVSKIYQAGEVEIQTTNTYMDRFPSQYTVQQCRNEIELHPSDTRMARLRARLHSLKKMHEEIRVACITDCKRDPGEGTSAAWLPDRETSDTDESDGFDTKDYRNIRDRLDAFKGDESREWMLTEPILRPRYRRDVRAWARISWYGCTTLHCKSMLVHKNSSKVPRRPRKKSTSVGTDALTDTDVRSALRAWGTTAGPLHNNIWQPREPRQSQEAYSSADSCDSVASTTSNKKRRLPKDEGAFACSYIGCREVFNRHCDLTHHQRAHMPYGERPYPCEECDMRFLFPKDLRRHEKKHQSGGKLSSGI